MASLWQHAHAARAGCRQDRGARARAQALPRGTTPRPAGSWPMPSSTTRWPPGASSRARCRPQWRDSSRARRRRRRARGADRAEPRAAARRCRRSRHRAGCDTRDRSRRRAPRRNRKRRIARARRSPSRSALSRAAASASRLDVGADADGVRQFGQQREQQRAGAGAEIGDAQRARARSAGVDRGERRLDHGFGFRPRHQRGGVSAQRQAPEFLDAEDARDRLALEPPRGERRDRVALASSPSARSRLDGERRCDRGRAHGRPAAARRARANRARPGETHRPARGAPARRSCRRQQHPMRWRRHQAPSAASSSA